VKLLTVISPTVHSSARQLLREALRRRPELICDVLEIQPGADISVAAAQCREGYDRVLAMGGDGTAAAVCQALDGAPVPLGILPAGTGNLVARELGIPLNPVDAFALATAPDAKTRAIDAMRIEGRMFLLNAGVGVNAETIDKTSRLGKTLFGRSAYIGTAVWKVLESKSIPLEIEVDGAMFAFKATDVLISNCGGLAHILHPNAPDIQPDDGRLDICVACMKIPLQYPWYYLRRWLFPRLQNKIIHEFTAARQVAVMSAVPVAVQADGDIIGETPATVRLVPHAVRILVP
jgi:diacylglycerol kinase (ATP)